MVAVDFGGIFAVVEVGERNADFMCALVGDAANEPVVAIAFLAGDDIIFADGAHNRDAGFPVDGDVVDEFKRARIDLLVEVRAVCRHLHTRRNGDKESELASEGGGKALGGVSDVEDAWGIVHWTREETRERNNTGVRWRECAALVFLTASALACEEVRESTFDTGALDRLVNVEAEVVFSGEFERFLVVKDAELGVVEFALALNVHH